jgi:transposase-like protein
LDLSDNLSIKNTNIYAGYRYPHQIISHAVWLYHKFTLSFRNIKELLSEKRLAITTYGKVRYQLKTPYRDGTTVDRRSHVLPV